MSYYINTNILSGNNSNALIYGFTDTQGYFINDSYKNFIPDFYGYLFACLSRQGKAYENMKKLGVSYIIFSSDTYPLCSAGDTKFITCQSRNNFRVFINKYGELIHKDGGFELYILK